MTPPADTYAAALKLVEAIDDGLGYAPAGWKNFGQWRASDGRLLRTLDEVVRAILTNNLIILNPLREGKIATENGPVVNWVKARQ